MQNYFSINFYSILLTIFYCSCFYFVFIILLRRFKLLTKTIIFATAIIYCVYLLFFFIDIIFNLKTIPPDTLVYQDLITNYNNAYSKYSFGVKGYSILNYIQFKLCFKIPSVFVAFNMFYYFAGIVYIFLAFQNFFSTQGIRVYRKHFLITFIIASIYPIGLINTASILREPMLIMFYCASIYFISKTLKQKFLSKRSVIFFVFCLLAVFIIRPITGISLLIILSITMIKKYRLLTFKRSLYLLFFISIVFYLSKSLILSVYNLDFGLSWIENYRIDKSIEYGVEGYGDINLSKVAKIIPNIALLTLQYYLSPLPILVPFQTTMQKIIPLVDSLFILFVVTFPIIAFYKKKYNNILFFFVIVLLIPAVFETNITGAYRHRMTAIILLLPLSSYIFSRISIRK